MISVVKCTALIFNGDRPRLKQKNNPHTPSPFQKKTLALIYCFHIFFQPPTCVKHRTCSKPKKNTSIHIPCGPSIFANNTIEHRFHNNLCLTLPHDCSSKTSFGVYLMGIVRAFSFIQKIQRKPFTK